MDIMAKECATCRYFTAYYEKAYHQFLRTDCGNCFKHKERVKKHGACEEWEYRRYFKRNLNNFIDSLDKAISDISAVKLILEEDSEEKNK